MARRAAFYSQHPVRTALLLITLVSACSEEPATGPMETPAAAKAATGPTITSTNPLSAPRDTTLDVQVVGTGFDQGSKAEFPLHGVVGPNIRTNRTTYKSAKELVANITVSADAVEAVYDVMVTTSSGKKGIGTERFAVEVYLELGTFGGSSSATGVNDAGWIVGRSDTAGSPGRAFVWDPQRRAMRSLGLSEAYDINAGLTIVGSDASGPLQWTYLAGSDSWQRASMPTLGGQYNNFATKINDAGQSVGRSSTVADVVHPILWQSASEMVDLGLPANADYANATGINTQGIIVGYSRVPGNPAQFDGFVWTPNVPNGTSGAMRTLPRYNRLARNFPQSITDGNVIVGYSEDAKGFPYAVRWQPLNDGTGGYAAPIALNAGGQPARAYDVNNAGVIVGQVGRNRSTSVACIWDAALGIHELFNPNGLEGFGKAISDGPTSFMVGSVLKGDFLLGSYSAVRWELPR